nr:transposase [Frankia gtarii]
MVDRAVERPVAGGASPSPSGVCELLGEAGRISVVQEEGSDRRRGDLFSELFHLPGRSGQVGEAGPAVGHRLVEAAARRCGAVTGDGVTQQPRPVPPVDPRRGDRGQPAAGGRERGGVDAGITALVALSTGEKVTNPKHEEGDSVRFARAQRNLAHEQKGSRNRAKAHVRVVRIHGRIADRRRDSLHTLSTRLIRENQMNWRPRAAADLGLLPWRRAAELCVSPGHRRVVDRAYPPGTDPGGADSLADPSPGRDARHIIT